MDPLFHWKWCTWSIQQSLLVPARRLARPVFWLLETRLFQASQTHEPFWLKPKPRLYDNFRVVRGARLFSS